MIASQNKLAIILVNWNTCDYLEKCLVSLYRYYDNPETEIWVIDNASIDGSVDKVQQKFPQVQVIGNSENVGFARACNQGIQASSSEYILLLNSDCELVSNCIDPILAGMGSNAQIGIAGAILLYPNGKVQMVGGELLTLKKVFFEQLFLRSASVFAEKMEDVQKRYGSTPFISVDFVSGACMFIRRTVLNQVGPLREDFFMYGEDLEFCVRARKNNFAAVVFTHESVIHHKCQSTNKNLEQALRHGLVNNTLLIAEFGGTGAAILALIFYFIGGLFRLLLSFFRPKVSSRAWFNLLLNYHRIVFAVVKKLKISL